jgi:Eukaryotic-type carbonic anhydrase
MFNLTRAALVTLMMLYRVSPTEAPPMMDGDTLKNVLQRVKAHQRINVDPHIGTRCIATIYLFSLQIFLISFVQVVTSNQSNMCGLSTQSPINIPTQTNTDDSLTYPLFISIKNGCSTWTQFSDEHTFEVSFIELETHCDHLRAVHGGREYTLQQIHFHSLSEHTIDHRSSDAEVHLVHRAEDKTMLVMAVRINAVVFILHLLYKSVS